MTVTIGVSLKMYFGHAQTMRWCAEVAGIARTRPAVASGLVDLFVVPSYPSIPGAVGLLDRTGVAVGAQDLATEDSGAFTGEVSGAELREVGCRLVEVGHAERRRLFGDTDEVVRAKTAAAVRNGLTPILCVGESERGTSADAAVAVTRQAQHALDGAGEGPVILAYEPVWAIGSAEPAPVEHIRAVARALRTVAAPRGDSGRVIYGGSAGPGLLSELGSDVDGLFLGRSAHDPGALATVIDEAAAVAARAR